MRLHHHKKEWWSDPDLSVNKVRVPKRYRNLDPLHSGEDLPAPRATKIGAFASSRSWIYYNRLQGMDVGYLVPVYSLSEIGMRFGLSQNAQRYFRKYILPEPFDIVRRRSVHAHHWSRFTLMALDDVLKDIEHRGYRQFKKSFTDHIDLVHAGTKWMADYYADKMDTTFNRGDKFGVTWLND